MTELTPPPPRPVTPILDLTRADLGTLVALGWTEPPPTPSPDPPWHVPPAPAPEPTPTETANEVVLQAALADAGVEKTATDEAVIDALAKLDPTTIQTVARWMKTKKKDPPKT